MSDITPSAALLRFARRQTRLARTSERRTESRHYVAVPVIVQRVDHQLNARGLPLAAVTRDISPSGMGLILERAVEQDLAAVRFQLEGEAVCLLIELLWRKPLGPFEYVGARVIRELDDLPTLRN